MCMRINCAHPDALCLCQDVTVISFSNNCLFFMRPNHQKNLVWIDRTIEGNREGTAAGILEECILDDDDGKCDRFSNALTTLDGLLGVGAGEQY